MPLSKRRKNKKGKPVGNGLAKNNEAHGARITVDPDKESTLTLQDLINVVAFQEYKEQGVIVQDEHGTHVAASALTHDPNHKIEDQKEND